MIVERKHLRDRIHRVVSVFMHHDGTPAQTADTA